MMMQKLRAVYPQGDDFITGVVVQSAGDVARWIADTTSRPVLCAVANRPRPADALSWRVGSCCIDRCCMDSPAEFRRRAQECLELMHRMSSEAKPILLSIAEAWLALAHD